MDKFLNTVIIIFLINIILVYLYQNLIKTEEIQVNENVRQNDKNINKEQNMLNSNVSCQKDWVKPLNFNNDRVLGHVYNFHQKFNDQLNNPKVRELGWRKYYLRHYKKPIDKNMNNFKHTVMDNYLANLESNRNVYLE
jgi:hypothetical protein